MTIEDKVEEYLYKKAPGITHLQNLAQATLHREFKSVIEETLRAGIEIGKESVANEA